MTTERIRFYQQDFSATDADRPCEKCGRDMREHRWADLDKNGGVFNCSEDDRA